MMPCPACGRGDVFGDEPAFETLSPLLAALKSPPIAGGEGELSREQKAALAEQAFALVMKYQEPPFRSKEWLGDNLAALMASITQPAEECVAPTTSGDVGKLCERLLLAGGNAFPHEPKTAKEEMCMQAATLLTQMEAREIALRDALETAESALDQLLDDMGETGQCVCPAAKFEAIDALANVRRTLNPTPTEER